MSALSWESLCVRYGGRVAASTGPMVFEAGMFVALLGPNGSGKSSLLKALVGAVSADVSGLRCGGGPMSARERARRIAYMSQTRTGPGLARVSDVVALGRFAHGGADPHERVGDALQRMALEAVAERRFGTLSGGEQARVLLARALAVGAPVLLADEPCASLDPHYALSIMAALRAEAARGTLVIVSLHDLVLARRFADRAVVMDNGAVVENGPVDSALSEPRLRDTFRVREAADGFYPLP